MGRSYTPHTFPFLLYETRDHCRMVEACWEDGPEEFEGSYYVVEGWSPHAEEGRIYGGTPWRKDGHYIEVHALDLIGGSHWVYVAEDRASLEAWKREHKIKGAILADEEVVFRG